MYSVVHIYTLSVKVPSSETSTFVIFPLSSITVKIILGDDVCVAPPINTTSRPSNGPNLQDFGIIFLANTPLLHVRCPSNELFELVRGDKDFDADLIDK